MNIWKISVFSETGENRSEQPISQGFVRADDIRRVSLLAHEAINEAAHSVTIEIETNNENLEFARLDPHAVKWIS